MAAPRNGGRILVDQLRLHGTKLAFGVPGESFLAALDAFYDMPDMRFIVCRQEGGAAMMADAYGKLTGEPGICFVTRGPGATNASPGIHIAQQDSTPLILFIGQVARDMQDREAFQEIDYRRMYGQLAKWVAQIDDPARIPEYVSRAFHTATSGRPGPVVLALPEDVLSTTATVGDARHYRRVETHPGPGALAELSVLLEAAKRPFVIVGGGGWSGEVAAAVRHFAERFHLPVGASFRCQDYFDNRHPCYAGDVGIGINPKLAARIKQSDLLLVIGARLGEMTTSGYSLIDIPLPAQKLVHVHPGAEELGRVYQPSLPINADMRSFASALPAIDLKEVKWKDWCSGAHADYLENAAPVKIPGALQMAEIAAWLSEKLPEDAILCNGAGNYTTWVHRFYRYKRYRTQLAPTSGSMGYGTPAAVAAKLVHPERLVIAFAGDGCFMMNGQELATAIQYELPIVIVIVNNGIYGTIRMHQERDFPGRVSGTNLRNPDFVALAKAYGAFSAKVERTEDFAQAFEAACASGKPAILELMLDPEVITPRTTLSALRKAGLKAS